MSIVETYKPKHIRHKEIKVLCTKYRIVNFRINSDYSIDVFGDVNLSNKNLNRIPIKFDEIYGNFECNFNNLKDLTNCPRIIHGNFSVYSNQIKDLSIHPEYIQGCFQIGQNKIKEATTFPIVGNTLQIDSNLLEHLSYDGRVIATNNKIYSVDNFNTVLSNVGVLLKNPIYELIKYITDAHFYLLGKSVSDTNVQSANDVLEKIIEFEIVKDTNVIDTISLNSLFDYYGIPFYESDVQVKMEPHGYVVI